MPLPARLTRPRLMPRRVTRKSPEARDLLIAGAGVRMPALIVRDSPTLMVAAVEDLCWRLGLEDWTRRKPPLWHQAARATWRDEHRRLEEKRSRIRSMIDESAYAS